MSTAHRAPTSDSGLRSVPTPPAPTDLVVVALRAADLAEVAAETAEWIAADLVRREATGAGSYGAAVGRIRVRAAHHRVHAGRLRAVARSA
jgi:hypothetical protein